MIHSILLLKFLISPLFTLFSITLHLFKLVGFDNLKLMGIFSISIVIMRINYSLVVLEASLEGSCVFLGVCIEISLLILSHIYDLGLDTVFFLMLLVSSLVTFD